MKYMNYRYLFIVGSCLFTNRSVLGEIAGKN